MKTSLKSPFNETEKGIEANNILRSCVHCGFCTATCPTYQLLGDELDSPRGRIYLIKELLEGNDVSTTTQQHLDRCLTCRSCETTCPSGVEYGRLLDIGRHAVEKKIKRTIPQQIIRYLLSEVLTNKKIFSYLIFLGRIAKPLMPAAIKRKIPSVESKQITWPKNSHARKMILLEGCVQSTLAPNINAASAKILDKLGIQAIISSAAGCCGAVTYHLNKQDKSLKQIKKNIDAWWPLIEKGAEAIVMTASGCGVTVKEYGYLLSDDLDYSKKAKRISEITFDLSEILTFEQDQLKIILNNKKTKNKRNEDFIAFHSPCTLQHGQKCKGKVETILEVANFELAFVKDAHLCCGSAGTYSILQPKISNKLLKNKIDALTKDTPKVIATANIGCLTHIQSGTEMRVVHWAELVLEKIQN